MKIVAAVFADFVSGPLGGAAQLQAEIAGQSILTRTLRRLAQVEGLAATCLFVMPRDQEAAARARADAQVADRIELLPLSPGPSSRAALIATARKWSLEAWRGNPLGLCWFDEFISPPAAAAVLDHYGADAVLCLSPYQPLLDPAIASAMIRHWLENGVTCRHVFTQAPPGLAGMLLPRECLVTLLELDIPVGLLLAYRPELAQWDPITQPSCYPVAPEIIQTAARFTGDTRRSRELLESALHDLGDSPTAGQLCNWVNQPGHDRAGPLPVEVELELTTADPLPDTRLRLRGSRVPHRELTDLAAVQRVAEELATYDDRLVWLGGHGDPLEHPEFASVCRTIRSAGVYGLAMTTALLRLTDQNLETLFDQRVDLIEVLLDTATPELYREVHGVEGHAQIVANIERIEKERLARRSPWPVLVPSQTRCSATLAELERFHDEWLARIGSALIRGYNDYAGLLPADTLLPTCPPVRIPCRRLSSRLMLLANGTIPLCFQDVAGEQALGDWTRDRLRDTWEGAALQAARIAHQGQDLAAYRRCEKCSEWSRP
jgi:hypothetical protein